MEWISNSTINAAETPEFIEESIKECIIELVAYIRENNNIKLVNSQTDEEQEADMGYYIKQYNK